jgi:ribosomal protein L28
MSRKCQLTGAKTQFGGNRKHKRGSSGAGGVWRYKAPRTNRTWKPNLRSVRLEKAGEIVKMKISMKAYKKLRKGETIDGYKLAPKKEKSQVQAKSQDKSKKSDDKK